MSSNTVFNPKLLSKSAGFLVFDKVSTFCYYTLYILIKKLTFCILSTIQAIR